MKYKNKACVKQALRVVFFYNRFALTDTILLIN